MRVPIICDGDWYALWFVEVDGNDVTTSQILTAEAQKIVEACREDEELEPGEESSWRVDPDGVQGCWTPNQSIQIQVRQEVYTETGHSTKWVTDCTLISPIYEP